MQFHPLANIFPLMSQSALLQLAHDIAANGLLMPIVLLRNMILDGRNRYLACKLLEIEPRFVEWAPDGEKGGYPLDFVISQNVQRRHLNESQRALAAARLATLTKGENPSRRGGGNSQSVEGKELANVSIDTSDSESHHPITRAKAATMLNVGEITVSRARQVLEHADESIVAAIDAGKVAVNDAVRITKRVKSVQRDALALVESGQFRTLARAAAGLRPIGSKKSPVAPHAPNTVERGTAKPLPDLILARRELKDVGELASGSALQIRRFVEKCPRVLNCDLLKSAADNLDRICARIKEWTNQTSD